MARTREDLIASIRSRIPYMEIRDLKYVESFIDGLGFDHFSDAEEAREVLTPEKQRQADLAYLCMVAIVEELKGNPPTGNTIVIPAREVIRMYHDTGRVRVRQADLFQWMEDAGYITSRQKVTTEAGKRIEMLYIPVEKFNWVKAAEDNSRASLYRRDAEWKEAAAV